MTTINTNTSATTAFVVTPDTTGTFVVNTGSGVGATAMTLDASQNATFAGNVVGVLKSGTAQTAPPPTPQYFDFTGIPATAKRITLILAGVSTNGTSDAIVQLGDSGGVENTGYVANASLITASTVAFSSTAGFPLSGSWSASVLFSGLVTLVLQDAATNTWAASVVGSTGSPVGAGVGGGYKPLSATLDRVRITTVGGANTFDAGTINIMWE